MASILTPEALKEMSDLLKTSRRFLSEVYRESKHGLSAEEISLNHGHDDPRKVKDCLNALKILFGRESLPKTGGGRQKAIFEAEYWLNSDKDLSKELEEHLSNILIDGERTNQRKDDFYEPPLPPSHREVNILEKWKERRPSSEWNPAVYMVTTESFLHLSELDDNPLIMKIGWSTNVWERLHNFQTWNPDPIQVLRVYPCENPNIMETKFHIALDSLGLRYENNGGREWFKASLALIDEMAANLGLEDISELEGNF